MKKVLFLSLALNILLLSTAGYFLSKRGKKILPPITSSPSWLAKKTLFESLPNDTSEILFVGNSLTDRCEWAELMNNIKIKNRGIDRDDTEGLLSRFNEIIESKPKAIFLEIGINDLELKRTSFIIIKNYNTLIDLIREESPSTELFIQSLLPVSAATSISNDTIIALNNKLSALCESRSITFINLYDSFQKNSQMNPSLTTDGVHLNGSGYLLWSNILKSYFETL